jgi:molecular chaperone HscA
MALLSIAEPGQAQAPHQHRLAIGIDLGTTNSLVAALRDGVATVLRDAEQLKLLPSVVQYRADGSTLVGFDARAQQPKDPYNVIASAKRLMGRKFDDLPPALRSHYRLQDTDGMVRIVTDLGLRSPVEVSAEILKVLRTRAELALGGELVGAVITVPAYFDDAQRQATKDAARLAGLNVLRLLNEPTAAAISYGLDRGSEGVYAVYDLGGGTFDLSILRLSRGVFEVLSVNGDAALGGDDFDRCVLEWLESQTDASALTPQDRSLLLQQARKAKECLSTQPEADVFARLSTGKALNLTLQRAQFEQLCNALVEKTLLPVRKALRDAKLTIQDIQGVVMIGGATRMPAIRRAVGEFFQREPLTDVDPDEAVALGAAMQADLLAGNHRTNGEWLLLDVTPLSLGLETMGGLVERIIPRNSTLPVARAQDFTTFKDGQTAMSVQVVQGERELVSDCRSLARFELRGIPPMVAGAARIRITFQVDADGLLNVSALEQSTGIQAQVTVKPSYGLDDSEIAAMLQDSTANAELDLRLRSLHEQRMEAERLLLSIQSVWEAESALIEPVERSSLEAAMTELRTLMNGDNADAIRVAAEALNQLSAPLAARRMNAAIQSAMAGHQLDEFA